MEILNTNYQIAQYDSNTGVLIQAWKKTSKHMNTQEYKEGILELMDLLDELKPRGIRHVLSDTKDFEFTISPEVQVWVAKTIRKKFVETRIQKFALIVSEYLFSQVSVEQAVQEVIPDNDMYTRYFDQRVLAMNWLTT